jgi:hypothetical protein
MIVALIFAVNPLLEGAGRIAAIVICLFAVVFIGLTVGINLIMAFFTSWLNEKVELIKVFRPYVDSVNTSSSAAERGVEPAATESSASRMAAQIPLRINAADKKVEQVSDSVVEKAIEFRARTLQVQQIAKAFFLPGLTYKAKAKKPAATLDDDGKQSVSPGYQALTNKERPAVVPGPAQEPRRQVPNAPREQIMRGQG